MTMGFNTLQCRMEGRGSWKTGSYAVATICHVMGLGDMPSSGYERLYSDNRIILCSSSKIIKERRILSASEGM